jgi:hypothetical protein
MKALLLYSILNCNIFLPDGGGGVQRKGEGGRGGGKGGRDGDGDGMVPVSQHPCLHGHIVNKMTLSIPLLLPANRRGPWPNSATRLATIVSTTFLRQAL